MTCPVCNDEGTVEIVVYTSEDDLTGRGREIRPCSAPSCIVAGVNRLYRELS